MSSSEVLRASGPLSRSAYYSRAADAVTRDPRADLSHTDLPHLADGSPLTALDAVGARLLTPRLLAPRLLALHMLAPRVALRARLRGRADP